MDGLCFCAAFLATAALIFSLGRRPITEAWVWFLLLIMIDGCFVQGFLIEQHIANHLFLPELGAVDSISPLRTSDALEWATLSYLTACAVMLFWVRRRRDAVTQSVDHEVGRPVIWQIRRLENVTLAAYIALSFAEQRLGLGVLGTVTHHLPLRLDTAVVRTRADLVPAILVLCIWLESKADEGRASRPLAMLVGAGVIDLFVTTSRGGLVNYLLPAVALWFVTGQLTRRRLAGIAAAGAVTVILFPLATGRRIAALAAGGAYQGAQPGGFRLSNAGTYLAHFVLRVSGDQQILQTLGHTPSFFDPGRLLSFLAGSGGDGPYFTHAIVHVTTPGDFRAPGFIAAFMMVGSLPVVCLLVGSYCATVGLVWTRLAHWTTGPAAMAVFAGWLVPFTADGGLNGTDVVALALSLMTLKVVYPHLVRP